MLKKSILSILVLILFASISNAQADRWQQRIDYKIKADLDVTTNIMKGTEEIVYTNNSPDTLRKVYFHMYWNAFQPNSSMDIRSRELTKIYEENISDTLANLILHFSSKQVKGEIVIVVDGKP